MTFEAFVRAFVGCYFLFVALHYTARLTGLAARRGFGHAETGDWRSANGAHQVVFRLFRLLILVVSLVRIGVPQLDTWLGLFGFAYATPVLAAGVVLMLVGLGLVDLGHSFMEEEWRSGIAGEPVSQLLTTGPYGLTRNPIFSGVLIAQAGFFLALPSVFTLVCLVVGYAVILRQVTVEERELARLFGAPYAEYRRRVPRWVFWPKGLPRLPRVKPEGR